MRLDLARLNYVLIPKTKEERDRLRRSWVGRVAVPFVDALWGSLTDEGRTLLLVTMLVGAFGLDVRATTAYVLFSVLAALIVASLVGGRMLPLRDVTVTVGAPRRVTVGEDVTFTVTLAHRGRDHDSPPMRVRGPFLTWDGVWVENAPAEVTVTAAGRANVTLTARFAARGVKHLDPFRAAAVVPLGLAYGPRRYTDALKVHVVPRIANVIGLPDAALTKHQPGGVALASKSGEARDLLGLRPYRPGDPVRDLHARSWARTGIPVVREYQQEYFTRVGVVLDTCIQDADLLEHAIELTAGVLANLSRGEALVDVLVVGDAVHELTMGRSLGYLDQALELLATVEEGPALTTDALLRRVDPYLDRLSSVILISTATMGERGREEVFRDLERRIRDRGVATTVVELDADVVRAIRAREAISF